MTVETFDRSALIRRGQHGARRLRFDRVIEVISGATLLSYADLNEEQRAR